MQRVSLWIFLSIIGTACGIPLGSGTPNDGKPSGTIIAQATLNGASGKDASGSASIYLNGSIYILRFDGLSVENEPNLQVIVNTVNTVALRTALRAPTGNQNYTIGAVVGQFANVEIFSTTAQVDYAKAVFPPTTP